ncbi:AIPR family protein [Treponema sp.]|uniref:AIPR family protein n=1 Tax=Treponema sp. TaxID=166 RepID=UPI00298E2ED4|nr:AIPR family protein [Treponema sp.]
MVYKFYDVAYVAKSHGDYLRRTINYNEVLKEDLIEHLAKIYEADDTVFQEYSDFAFMDTRFHDMDGNKLYAFFTQNRNTSARQPWALSSIKTEAQIDELCNPEEPEDEEPVVEQPKTKKIIQDVKTYFDDTPINNKSSVKSLLDLYRKEHSGNDQRDGVVFERMLTQAIIENDSPNSISNDEALLDTICVDDYFDSGIDSICIRVNGHIVTSLDFLKFIIEKDKGIRTAEIILIQSKCKDKFDLKEISTFILGVQNFLEPVSSRKLNAKVQLWFNIKNEILENVQYWTDMNHIDVRLFYAAANATWTNSSEVLGSFETLKKATERFENGVYKIESPVFIDEKRLQKISVNENETYSAKLALQGTPLQLAGDDSVMGCAAIINATDLLGILIDETTGNLKRGLFEENVRDYQGNTNVNQSIRETIKNAPESFILRNNGITILANRLEYPNLNSVRITNPQIVNGCQTCSVIYYAHKEGLDLSKVQVFARIISTNETETINSIVSANNNQNMVHDMINEITKEYHKKLETYFREYDDVAESRHVYYERRSKSLANENICAYQKCTFKTLIQSSVAVWFDAPYDAVDSEFRLLPKYKDQVFSDNHMEICYYASASLFSVFDLLVYENRIDSTWRSARPFICYLVKKNISPNSVSLNDNAASEALARKILSLLKNPNEYLEEFERALNIFIKAKELFKQQNNKLMNDYLGSQKVMSYINGAVAQYANKPEEQEETAVTTFSGKIRRIGRDRNGLSYMFISRGDDSIFAHQNFSSNSFGKFQSGQTVIYEVGKDKFDRVQALNVRR